MKERVFQLRLDGELAKDVTPRNFNGFEYALKSDTTIQSIERFVREINVVHQIKSPTDAATYLMENVYAPFHEFQQEEIWVLLMNTKNVLTHDVLMYRGSLNSCTIRVGEIFREAIRFNSAAIIVAHNHPSGDPTPSPEDANVTREIHSASKILEIELLDHLVIGKQRWISLKERGAGFPSS